MNRGWWLTRVLLPVGVPLGALVVAAGLIALSPAANREPAQPLVARVEVVSVSATEAVPQVVGTGTVVPARQVTLLAEVAGKVVHRSDELMPGGRFAQGDVLLKLDDRVYQATLDAERSLLAQADRKIDRDLSRAAVAQAELKLAGATMRAPFDGVLTEGSVELGQLLAPGTPVAVLVGTESVWVRLSVPLEQVRLITVPEGDAPGSTGVARQRLSDGTVIERPARVLKLLGTLDPATRTAQVLVEIAEPYAGELPLLPGAQVEVVLDGALPAPAFVVPRAAVRDGDTLWVVAEGEVLEKRTITTAASQADTVVVTSGLSDGDRVVTSPLSLPIQGMTVTTEGL